MATSYKAIYFVQKPFTANTEQIGCYYFNILSAVEYAKKIGAAIVPPILPLAPRDNTLAEEHSDKHWLVSILDFGTIDSTKVLDYSKINTLTLKDFFTASDGNVNMVDETLCILGFKFNKSINSKYKIEDLPGRWDTQGKDPFIFYKTLYPTLPFKNDIIIDKPEWYTAKSKLTYLGLHWRRGDRGNITLGDIGKYLWKATEPTNVSSIINNYIELHPEIKWVYVSTNSGSNYDRNILRKMVIRELIYQDEVECEPLERWKWDIMDMQICSQCSHLILSPVNLVNSSAFGRLIFAEFIRRGGSERNVSFIPITSI